MNALPHSPPARRRRRPLLRGRLPIAVIVLFAAAAANPVPAGAQTDTSGPDLSAASGDDTAGASAFDAQGMWIWYVGRSHGGDPARIIGRARRSRVGTVYVKAGDGPRTWSQFTASLLDALHAGGLKVCAWQFIYGDAPYKEANVGAAAVERGADCVIIDAEGHYEGKYASADRYIRKLRSQIGEDFPVSLAGFPYIDYHPGFPYSVFLGPQGAQYNQPQMYWKSIGTSVRRVFSHTYRYNRVFRRPIYPIGQTYMDPGRRMIKRFRRLSINYGTGGVSWWSWQETSGREWGALGRTVGRIRGLQPSFALPLLKRGSKGDLVVWAQQHLLAAGAVLPVTGLFRRQTESAVIDFQLRNGLLADGVIGAATWRKLLDHSPVRIAWGARTTRSGARSISARPGGANAPLSASLPPRSHEIDPGPRP